MLLWGGVGPDGSVLPSGERFDPAQQRFLPVTTLPAMPPTPQLEASLPPDGATGVPLDAPIALRFSKPLRVDTLTPITVLLSGPQGVEPARVVPAEGGRLAFVTPVTALQPETSYTLTLNGPSDGDGFLLPFAALRFTTGLAARSSQTGAASSMPAGATATSPIAGPLIGSAVQEEWIPDARALAGDWQTHRPDSRWRTLPPLQADPGVTALAGQVLRLNGEPLANVTLRIADRAAQTDQTGRFLLSVVPAGHQVVLINGHTASRPGATYGVFEVGVDVAQGQTTVLPYTIWMPRIDTEHAVTIPSPTTAEAVVTTPRIPGLEVRIPPNTVIRDHYGQVLTQLSITPIPIDRPPFPLPRGVGVSIYFTIQPGGAYLSGPQGARLIYPNAKQELAGTRFNFWNYDPEGNGWSIYGLGTVTEDGRQVVPDPGVTIYEFTGAMVADPATAPAEGPPPGDPAGDDGEPVNLLTGLFVVRKTDLVLPDVLPIVLTRTYRTRDTRSRAFGIGATHPYDMFLVGDTNPWTWIDLILPDGGRIHYVRISPGTGLGDAEFEHTEAPTRFYKSRIKYNASVIGWELTLKDGTVYTFGDMAPLQSIRDRDGNKLTITRAGTPAGNVTRIISPHGRWVEFAYDTGNRITQARDNLGRTVTYTYDATGRLTTVTDPAGGVTEYTYDGSQRMVTLKDARGIVFLTSQYDAAGKVISQTQADGTTYQFAYTLDANGKVTQTDVTNPRGHVRRVTFNSSGYVLTDTHALSQPEQQTTTYERQAGTNLVLSVTDPLGRRAAFGYDAMGNVTAITRLAGTPQAVTTTLTYEPTFNQVTSVTDPLGHTTSFGYDGLGNLITLINPLGQQTTLAYNAAGQPVSVTDPLGQPTQFDYDAGDLVAVRDPLGNRTARFPDSAGRLTSLTNPLGNTTRYEYDALNRVTRVIDALGGVTAFGYDPNGNLLSVTDARGNATRYTYSSMDRLASRTDPLLRAESYGYDNAGNLTSFTNRKSQVTSSTYDALNRRTQVTYTDGSTTTYTWDAGNRLTQVVDSLSGTITRSYDNLDRLTQEVSPQGTVSDTYDAAGRRTSMTVLGQPTVTYTYDNANRVTQITQGTATVTFAYDAAGRRTSLTPSNGVVTDYTYDAARRLTGLTYKNGPSVLGTLTYAYDAAGNRTQVGGTWARTGLPQAVASATYNAANHQLTFGSQTLTYDLNGNLTTDSTTTYTWDARNRLVSLSGPGTSATFQYDPLGRRPRKVVSGATTDFLYDGVNPVQELSGATVLANLLTGPGVDEYFTRTDAGGTHTFLTDALGSTLALTDTTGAVQTQYTYEPFGATTASGPTNANPFQYTGREDDGTGLYYYRARYYHPGLQRFISEDSIGLVQGTTNLYTYVSNNPLRFVDPRGLQEEPWVRYYYGPHERPCQPGECALPTPEEQAEQAAALRQLLMDLYRLGQRAFCVRWPALCTQGEDLFRLPIPMPGPTPAEAAPFEAGYRVPFSPSTPEGPAPLGGRKDKPLAPGS